MQDIMIDLETLGKCAGCSILSIGAIAFDEFGVAEDGLYTIISRESCKASGLHEDPETLKWWGEQSVDAKKVLHASATRGLAVTLASGLMQLGNFIQEVSPVARVWGNGADFDNAIIMAAARAAGLNPKSLWQPYNGRCYRTVKNQFYDVKMQRKGTHHNALDDARSQAEHLVRMCQERGWRLA